MLCELNFEKPSHCSNVAMFEDQILQRSTCIISAAYGTMIQVFIAAISPSSPCSSVKAVVIISKWHLFKGESGGHDHILL